MYVPDNYDMFLQHDAELARSLESRPICDECVEHIQDDFYYEFDGTKICKSCLNFYHKKTLED